MKRLIYIILPLFLFFINIPANCSSAFVTKDIKTITKDGFCIMGTLSYPKIKTQKEFKTIVLLHSLGYNSQWWGTLPNELLNKGYAVLNIDLRGHGKSVYNSKLAKVSWKNMTNNAYAKYPQDVLSVINTVKENNPKRIFFNQWGIIGCDIGASAGVIAADSYSVKPKTIIMLCPVVKTKGLYVPVNLAQLDKVDILMLSGKHDVEAKKSSDYLKRFVQGNTVIITPDSQTSGMVMVKNTPEVNSIILEWLSQYFEQ